MDRSVRDCEIVKLYQTYGLKDVAESVGMSVMGVRSVLLRHGATMRPKGFHIAPEGYGCTEEQWAELKQLDAIALPRSRSPIIAFCKQRHAAKTRGIAWDLSLWAWWQVWCASGKWNKRSVGQGYVMCRRGDVGAYSVDNVFIDLTARNSSIKPSKKSGLHIGVRRRGSKFCAVRSLNGQMMHLGTFKTEMEAARAYLSTFDCETALIIQGASS